MCFNCVCVGGVQSCGCHFFTASNSKGWYFSSQAPAHPVSKDTHQAHFLFLSLSYILRPTFNGKTQHFVVLLETFSVAMYKSTIAVASSLSLSAVVTLLLMLLLKEGSLTWVIGVVLDTEGERELSFYQHRERRKTNILALHAGCTVQKPNVWSQFDFQMMTSAFKLL